MTKITDQPKMVPVILSGGSGTRLWPVSRRAHPKPFMKLVDGESLAEKTFRRLKAYRQLPTLRAALEQHATNVMNDSMLENARTAA